MYDSGTDKCFDCTALKWIWTETSCKACEEVGIQTTSDDDQNSCQKVELALTQTAIKGKLLIPLTVGIILLLGALSLWKKMNERYVSKYFFLLKNNFFYHLFISFLNIIYLLLISYLRRNFKEKKSKKR